jgi:hypothetical protein
VLATIGQFTAFWGDASVQHHSEQIGPRFSEVGTQGDKRVPNSGRETKEDFRPQIVAILAPAGEYWTIGYPGRTFPLKDYKGLTYVHRLLQHPGEEFHALDLLRGGVASPTPEGESLSGDWSGLTRLADLGDAGEMLDAQAKQEYKRRLIELREDLDQALALEISSRRRESKPK